MWEAMAINYRSIDTVPNNLAGYPFFIAHVHTLGQSSGFEVLGILEKLLEDL